MSALFIIPFFQQPLNYTFIAKKLEVSSFINILGSPFRERRITVKLDRQGDRGGGGGGNNFAFRVVACNITYSFCPRATCTREASAFAEFFKFVNMNCIKKLTRRNVQHRLLLAYDPRRSRDYSKLSREFSCVERGESLSDYKSSRRYAEEN